MRYSYLKGEDGKFYNPYDQGFQKNCSDFLLHGYMEDARLPKQPISQIELGMV